MTRSVEHLTEFDNSFVRFLEAWDLEQISGADFDRRTGSGAHRSTLRLGGQSSHLEGASFRNSLLVCQKPVAREAPQETTLFGTLSRTCSEFSVSFNGVRKL